MIIGLVLIVICIPIYLFAWWQGIVVSARCLTDLTNRARTWNLTKVLRGSQAFGIGIIVSILSLALGFCWAQPFQYFNLLSTVFGLSIGLPLVVAYWHDRNSNSSCCRPLLLFVMLPILFSAGQLSVCTCLWLLGLN